MRWCPLDVAPLARRTCPAVPSLTTMVFRQRLFALLSLGLLAGGVDAQTPLDGIYALAKRRVPTHAHAFSFSLGRGEPDSFVIKDAHSGIHVECATVSACARGFYT